MLAMSVAQATRIEIALTQHALGRLKAKYYAWAGLMFSMQQIRLDSSDASSSQEDTLSFCGIRKGQKESLEELFHERPIGDGYFSCELEDEERRLNVNALTLENVNVFIALFEALEIDQNTAQTIAFSIADWEDPDHVPNDPSYGAEDEYYSGLDQPFKCKNAPLDSLEELFLVRGMTPEIFEKIEPSLTIFPRQGFLFVNINTASEKVLHALAAAVAGSATNTTEGDVDSLVAKILDYRGADEDFQGRREDWFTQFQQRLNAKEQAIFLTLNRYWTFKSDYFRVESEGAAGPRKVSVNLEAIIERASLSMAALKMR